MDLSPDSNKTEADKKKQKKQQQEAAQGMGNDLIGHLFIRFISAAGKLNDLEPKEVAEMLAHPQEMGEYTRKVIEIQNEMDVPDELKEAMEEAEGE